MNVNFTMFFGEDNKLEIEADVTPIQDAIIDHDHGGEQACGGDVEIISCDLIDEEGHRVPFDPEGIYTRPFGKFINTHLVEDINDKAVEELREL